ncbi:MAG: 50S ribosomal protein L21 [Spirochaetaceae bacterium]|nr:MAG: 50S ribosomal protein L21 [Spirochaetaceae bacterium]
MYAMVEILGSQYKAEKGSTLTIDRIASDTGSIVEYDTVLMLRTDDEVKVGDPYVSGARVKAVVEEHVRADKVIVHKYKRRKRYKRTAGHRQPYSVIRVEEITG